MGLRGFAARQIGWQNVNYLLVDYHNYMPMQTAAIRAGYTRLGVTGWRGGDGVPLREQAISYGAKLGADYVIYTTIPASKNGGSNRHFIAFLARPVSSR
jgi:hypothetical protein